jgi:peptidoglycan-N-acetylglucosamine deacetylase
MQLSLNLLIKTIQLFKIRPATSDILDILRKNHVSATFFVVGQTIEYNPAYRKVLQRIVDDGHTLGGHSYTHADLTQLSSWGITDEIEKTSDVIERAIGDRPRFVRPPYG